mgnify:CR=1 FL=1
MLQILDSPIGIFIAIAFFVAAVLVLRALWMWLLGINEVLVELRAILAELRALRQSVGASAPPPPPAPATMPPPPVGLTKMLPGASRLTGTQPPHP